MENNDCKTCAHARVLYLRENEDRFTNAYSPSGYVRCRGPRYKGRVYFVRDSKPGCADYERKGRGT